jgi:integrase/recombinase XerC
MPDLPPIIIVPTHPQLPTPSIALERERSIWADFLSLKISAHTQRAYAQGIADFCDRVYGEPPSPDSIARFLKLPQSEALFQVLDYRWMLIEAKLAPSTINVRLSAIKSLVEYGRKQGACQFSLEDIPSIKGETYRDTTGIGVAEFKNSLALPDRTTAIGARDYAILRLLWDHALRRNEVCSLDVNDFNRSGKLAILGKGKIQKKPIDLTDGAIRAVGEWLAWRDGVKDDDPLFISLSRHQYGHRLDGSSVYRLVRKFSEAAGIEKVVSPHRIRHSAITAYLDASDGNIRAAQALSRHSNLNTLTRYDDNRQRQQQKASDLLGDLIDGEPI